MAATCKWSMIIPCAVVLLPCAGEQCGSWAVGCAVEAAAPAPIISLMSRALQPHCYWSGSSPTGSSPTAGSHNGIITRIVAVARQRKASAILSPAGNGSKEGCELHSGEATAASLTSLAPAVVFPWGKQS